jgi:ATP-dependent RNA helicase DDX21
MVAAGGDVIVKKKVKKINNIPAEAGAEALSDKKVKKQKGTDTGEVTVEKKKKKRKAETEADAVVSDEPVKKKKKVKKSEPESKGPSPAGSDSAESEQCALDVSDSKPADPLALDNFRLSPAIKGLLRQKGIESLFNIQAQTLTSVLDGFDLVGRAR